MGMLDRIKSAFSHDGLAAGADELPALITVYDAYGRQVQVARREWETKVLPATLAEANDDPDRLYATIAAALEDGFVEQLVAPTQRLLEIDPNRQRSAIARSIVLLKSGDLDGAEQVLGNYIERSGASGVVLVNLAKVQDAKGHAAEAEATLWHALELDPNQDNGLLWWCAIQRDKSGNEADFWSAMHKVAKLEAAWRPQLWLARQALDERDLAQAKQLYQHVLARAVDEPEVLMMISGDLGNHGHVDEILELVLPVYDPQRHDAWTGLNLLEACLSTNNLGEGESLLNRMFALNIPPLKERLFHYAAEFDKLRAAEPRRVATADEQIDVEVLQFDRPIWNYGLHDPTWLFASHVERGDEIALLPLANVTQTDMDAPTAQREDDLGRLTRSVPLYLLESLFFWSTLRPKLALPVVRGRGPVVVGTAWAEEQVYALAGGARFAVSGTIEASGEELKLEITLWDCVLQRALKHLAYSAKSADLGETVLRLEQDVLEQLSGSGASMTPCESYYGRPGGGAMSPYLTCLGQTLMLSLVQNDVIPRNALWGERNILEYSLAAALNAPQSQVAKTIFCGTLVKSHEIGSQVFAEFKRQSLQLVTEEADRTAPFYRLSPLLLRIFDPEMFHLRKAELLADASEDYRRWLAPLVV